MDDTKKELLRQIAAKNGYRTDRQISAQMGICYQTFSRKINGKSDWTLRDIKKAQRVFNINATTAAKIFL